MKNVQEKILPLLVMKMSRKHRNILFQTLRLKSQTGSKTDVFTVPDKYLFSYKDRDRSLED